MTKPMKIALTLVTAALAVATSDRSTQAAYTLYIYQSGSNVLMQGSGSLDTTDLIYDSMTVWGGQVYSSSNDTQVGVGPMSSPASLYTGTFSGPENLGPGGNLVGATTGSGNVVGLEVDVFGNSPPYTSYYSLLTPVGYISGTQLGISTSTFNNQSLSGLGLAAGTYTYTWGTGVDADSFTINVGTAPSSVPEPSSLVLCGIAGLCGLAYRLRRRRRASPSTSNRAMQPTRT
jgi:PEP-CTERM motif